MDALDLNYLQYSALGWALWKALDHLMLRYFPAWWPESRNGHGAQARQARIGELLRSEAFAEACRELQDEQSPVMRALSAVWTARQAASRDERVVEHALARLSTEEGLVVMAVLAQAGQAS